MIDDDEGEWKRTEENNSMYDNDKLASASCKLATVTNMTVHGT